MRRKPRRAPDVPHALFFKNLVAPLANIIRVPKRTFMAAAATRLKPANKAGEVEILSRRNPPSAAAYEYGN